MYAISLNINDFYKNDCSSLNHNPILNLKPQMGSWEPRLDVPLQLIALIENQIYGAEYHMKVHLHHACVT